VSVTDFNNVTKVVEVTVTAPDALEVEFSSVAPNSFNTCNGEVLAEVSGGVGEIEYSWLGTFGHSGNTQRAEGLCAGEFLNFIITDDNGCRIESETKVDNPADGCLQFRPVITPGEKDGKNDFLLITCIEEVKTNTVEIYNRWGQLVFETEGYSNDETSSKCWKGTNKNDQPLAEGVYYYVLRYINVTGEEVETKGHINLLR
jgi:gliding motility-associated-like protein